jgi:hypothetical protein
VGGGPGWGGAGGGDAGAEEDGGACLEVGERACAWRGSREQGD